MSGAILGSDHESRQDCPPAIRNQLELWFVVETDDQLGRLDSNDDWSGGRFILFSGHRVEVVFG
jgi:hypothetical protein